MPATYSLSHLFNCCIAYCWLNFLRPVVKGFLRRTTGLCELQRICYSTHGASRCIQVQSSISFSRSPVIRKVRHRLIIHPPGSKTQQAESEVEERTESTAAEEAQLIEYAVEAICQEKQIKLPIHEQFVSSLRVCLTQLFYYKTVAHEAVRLAATPFDKENEEHRSLLLGLWNSLMQAQETDITKPDWTEIGFQGKDPATDFRAMGLLGLHQLHFFATRCPDLSQNIVSACKHPVKGYPFAITGINLTHLTLSLMREEHLRPQFFNSTNSQFWLQDLHQAYVLIFSAFHKFWLHEDPSDIMQFRFVREKFVLQLTSHLSQTDVTLSDWSCPEIQDV